MKTFVLPDTRPYPQSPIKNHLLLNAYQLAHNSSSASRKLSAGQLQTEIRTMLSQNHYINLSLAMTMAPDVGTYTSLIQSVGEVLKAENDNEAQWFALPVVLVAGCKKEQTLPLTLPTEALFACLQNYPNLRTLTQNTQWLPYLVQSTDLSSVTPGEWFQAKQNDEAAGAFLQKFEYKPLTLPEGQSVHVVYALGYGNKDIQTALGLNLQQAGLPLMQVWQEHLALDGVTLFTNPLSPNTPLDALTDGSHTRQRMAMDVFATNAIRAIRMQSPRVGVVAAAKADGKLQFSFNATDSAFEIVPQTFTWELASTDNIAIVQQNFLDLMAECRIEHLYLLHNPLGENENIPTYAQALKLEGHNPFFSNVN
ncbi:conjugal transfer protein [Neisseria sp. P0004.S004]|jgi:hypothetical protein|uniref:hypothetical protein n=1 Tax=unclassified Neisseria TaxID=2623750 RepID=UPI00066DD12A